MGVYEDEAGARRANQNGLLKVIAEAAASQPGDVMRDDGNVDTAFADAPRERMWRVRARVSTPVSAAIFALAK